MATLPIPTLMLVTDRKTAGGDDALLVKVRDAVAGGVNVVQVRANEISPPEQVALVERVREAIAGRALLIVNSWSHVAEAVNADGVQLPEDAPATTTGRDLLVGRSVHSVESARRAEAEGADYVIAGPVYETPTHPGAKAAGVALLCDIVAAVSVPVIAIGGIDAQRVPEVMAAGASGIAVVSAILAADDTEAGARALRDALSHPGAVTSG